MSAVSKIFEKVLMTKLKILLWSLVNINWIANWIEWHCRRVANNFLPGYNFIRLIRNSLIFCVAFLLWKQ